MHFVISAYHNNSHNSKSTLRILWKTVELFNECRKTYRRRNKVTMIYFLSNYNKKRKHVNWQHGLFTNFDGNIMVNGDRSVEKVRHEVLWKKSFRKKFFEKPSFFSIKYFSIKITRWKLKICIEKKVYRVIFIQYKILHGANRASYVYTCYMDYMCETNT